MVCLGHACSKTLQSLGAEDGGGGGDARERGWLWISY